MRTGRVGEHRHHVVQRRDTVCKAAGHRVIRVEQAGLGVDDRLAVELSPGRHVVNEHAVDPVDFALHAAAGRIVQGGVGRTGGLAFAGEDRGVDIALRGVALTLVDVHGDDADAADHAGARQVDPLGRAGNCVAGAEGAFVRIAPDRFALAHGLEPVGQGEQAGDFAARAVDFEQHGVDLGIVHRLVDQTRGAVIAAHAAQRIEPAAALHERAE